MPKIKTKRIVSRKRKSPPTEKDYDDIYNRFLKTNKYLSGITDLETFEKAWQAYLKRAVDEDKRFGQKQFLKKARKKILDRMIKEYPERIEFTEKGIIRGKVVPARVDVIITLRDIEGHKLKFKSKKQEQAIKKKIKKVLNKK